MRGRLGFATTAALALAALGAGSASAAAERPRPNKDDRAADCTSNATPGNGSRVRITIWCGAQEGRVKFTLRRSDGAALERFSARPRASGPGAPGGFACRRHGPGAAVCRGRKEGPATIRAWLASPGEPACRVPLHIALPSRLYVGTPFGCRPGERERRPRLREIVSSRRSYGLDLDLGGDAEAIRARARALQRNWLRGEPVARWMVSTIGVPMFARDQLEWEARQNWVAILGDNVYRWVHEQRLGRVFADYYVDDEAGGVLHVGFTADQEALVAALERRFRQIPADRIEPFPFRPAHSIAALEQLQGAILRDRKLWNLATSVGIEVERNVVAVGSQHVAELRSLFAERFGPQAPISVAYEEPIRLLGTAALYSRRG